MTTSPETRTSLEREVAELEADIEVLHSFVVAAQGEQAKLEARLQLLHSQLAQLSGRQTFAEAALADTSTPR